MVKKAGYIPHKTESPSTGFCLVWKEVRFNPELFVVWSGSYLIQKSYKTLHRFRASFMTVFRVGIFLGTPWTVSYVEASLTQSDFSTSWDLLKTNTGLVPSECTDFKPLKYPGKQ